MRRRLVLSAAASLTANGVSAQTPARLHKVGGLKNGSVPHPLPELLRASLTGLGWVEGRTMIE